MKKKKIRIGVLCGGKSAEHEISLLSARNVVAALDRDKYEVVLIGIDKTGQWFLNDASRLFLESGGPDLPALTRGEEAEGVTLAAQNAGAAELVRASDRAPLGRLDVIFPVLHGPFGEDGTVQGLLRLANIPFVGASVLGSAVGMDKDVMKRLLRDAGIPTPDFLAFTRASEIGFDAVAERLGLPVFVKPANMGSSVGVSRVASREAFEAAVAEAFAYDRKVLAEAFIEGREIECSVLGNEEPIASIPGEVIPRHEFYSYEAKYLDENGALLKIPAELPEAVALKVQEMAVRAFCALCCEGMARVDFFLRGEDEVFVNEINTIPGFTRISMYPKLWEASGVFPPELVDRLVQLALDRHRQEQELKTSYEGRGQR